MSDNTNKRFLYKEDDNGGEITIFGYEGTDTVLYIPRSFQDLPVTAIDAGTFYKCRSIATVIIPYTVMVIHSDAFAYCPNLRAVHMPNGIMTIEYGAFAGCRKLEKVNIPCELDYIPEFMFYGCSSLKDIIIPYIENIDIGDHAFYGCNNLDDGLKEQIKSINKRAFMPREVYCEVFSGVDINDDFPDDEIYDNITDNSKYVEVIRNSDRIK